ncbi:G patch domain and ankyrin repeat-containing protein 1 [Dunckerocampus dactyliophorus]|uniref:G patch domain and ankyrin repeat-containing protein 1 n=1 Tax=Dunckerocampus dactyliophorus TaxID=161453 RepID=UPI00240742CA|nr:G patch domain and ankyrin repeat-containing protein 1 [Dunckerocampus dactyliophorus]
MAGLSFIPARKQDVFSIETVNPSRYRSSDASSGEEARQFYEHVTKDVKVEEGTLKTQCERLHQRKHTDRDSSRRRRASEIPVQTNMVERRAGEGSQRRETAQGLIMNSERLLEFQGLKLLRCAQEGNLAGVKDLLSNGADINFKDSFFWTGLMCASWSGQRAAVRLLLEQGAAWVGVVDTQGRDARDLALQAGHSGVLEELESYGRSPSPPRQTDSALQPQWCDVCHSSYTSSLSSHLSSTLHQFSRQRPPPAPYYCLPPSSNSYKMMLNCGWQPGKGLGPKGEGSKLPVATILKRDQKGLGYGKLKKAKVTHFKARDQDAVKGHHAEKEETGRKGKTNEESQRNEQKDKNWERDFRSSFYL